MAHSQGSSASHMRGCLVQQRHYFSKKKIKLLLAPGRAHAVSIVLLLLGSLVETRNNAWEKSLHLLLLPLSIQEVSIAYFEAAECGRGLKKRTNTSAAPSRRANVASIANEQSSSAAGTLYEMK